MRKNILNLINPVWAIGVIAVLFSACQRPAVSLPIGQEIEVKLHQTYQVDNTLSFTIENVQDSRCPMDAICIQAGKAEVKVQCKLENKSSWYTIDPENQPEIRLGNYQLRFTELFPYPQSTVRVRDEDYTLKVLISAL
ncbi:hypothetical protein QWY31_11830 [Cytophagales bacterium LB-30]|uniref:DUF1425 domain-containing protein n=1 Tax=Shiella aurantiaca TaxID=3058365 RepID=A0ABT8F7K3_9BACT|nr:hypothetical protein [Shiella aurantiaca]MDN4166196.1 hypothetical protein [Shiella aurantiaca]